MSSEGDDVKNVSSETNEKSATDTEDSSQDSQDVKDVKEEKEGKAKSEESDDKEVKPKEDVKPPPSDKPEKDQNNLEKQGKEKDTKVNDVDGKKSKEDNKTGNDTEDGEGSDKEDEESEKSDKGVPLLDQPLEQSGPRERKKVQRFNEEFNEVKETSKIEIPEGSGTALGEIPRIDASISRFKNEDLKLLHRLLFKTPGKTTVIKKNIKKFCGFDFKKDSEEYTKKIASVQKFEVKHLKSICEMLDLEKKGNKEEIGTRIVDFLLEPKDSGKPVGGGRPKRTAAVRANNRGYSSHDDDYSSDERHSARARRDKGKRTNLKEESSSESDEDFHPSDGSDERPRVNKRQKNKRKKPQSDDEASDIDESPSSEDSDDEPKNKRKKVISKVANSKAKGKSTPKPRGRKPAAATPNKKKAQTPKGGRKRKNSSEEESDHQDDGSSSEDEPLVKKAKTSQPPTDDEIKSYVKEILEGANLEEITMKTVCKQVYAHYPDFDLSHKKDFIKSTVKSLIST